MHPNKTLRPNRRSSRTILFAGALMVLSACASTPPPSSALEAASGAITNAERANAGRFAAVELGEAREKLAQANSAAGAKDMILAEQLAEEARVSADLAYARTEAVKAERVNKEMDLGAEALEEEMQRAGDQQ